MSLAKMEYEVTPTKSIKPHKLTQLERVSTSSILWYLIKRHKTGLLATWAIGVTTLYIFPPLPSVLFSLMGL